MRVPTHVGVEVGETRRVDVHPFEEVLARIVGGLERATPTSFWTMLDQDRQGGSEET